MILSAKKANVKIVQDPNNPNKKKKKGEKNGSTHCKHEGFQDKHFNISPLETQINNEIT